MKRAQSNDEQGKYKQALARLEQRARLLDSQFRVPFTRIRFGLDPLIGLLPGIGDLVGMVLSLHLIVEAIRIGAGPVAVVRMLANVLVESIVGIIPIAGDAFDLYWKANNRNAAILRRYLNKKLEPARPHHNWISYALVITLGALIVALMFLVVNSIWAQS